MRHLFVFACLAALGTHAGAEVIRCTDAAGKVSYTDGACAAGTRQVGKLDLPEVTPPTPEELDRLRQAEVDRERRTDRMQRDAAEAVLRQPPPSGPIVIDSRGNAGNGLNTGNGNGNERPANSRWSERGADVVYDGDPGNYYPYPYPYPGGGYRPAQRPRDMRPQIRNCGPAGCTDTQGNTYNRSGQLDRYRSIDGRTCRPVGTTTVCH